MALKTYAYKRLRVINVEGTDFDNANTRHWFGARDGYNYGNGVQCVGGTAFADVGGTTKNLADWRFSTDNPWGHSTYSYDGTISLIPGSSAVRLARGTGASINWTEACFLETRPRWYLTGDFDISLYLTNFSKSSGGGTDFLVNFIVLDSFNKANYTEVNYGHYTSGSCFFSRFAIVNDIEKNRVWSSSVTSSVFYLRIVRTSSTLKYYYKTTGGWVQIGGDISSDTGIGTNPVMVKVALQGYGNYLGTCDLNSQTITTGTVLSTTGWNRESPSVTRGSRADFPRWLAVLGTNIGIELRDLENNQSWMTFNRGTNYALWSGGEDLQQAQKFAWNSWGNLYCAYGSQLGTGGGLINIDFALDRISRQRTDGYAYWENSFSCCNGGILTRNTGNNYGTVSGATLLPANSVLSCATYTPSNEVPGDYCYWVVGTISGLRIIRNKLYVTYARGPANPTEYSTASILSRTHHCFFDSSGAIFGITETQVYKTQRTTWENAMPAGTFVPDLVKDLPGNLSQATQYVAAIDTNSHLYTCSDEGIWRCTWGTDELSLYFGSSESTATNKTLPDYTSVETITHFDDGSGDLLASCLNGTTRCLVIIDTSTEEVTTVPNVTNLYPFDGQTSANPWPYIQFDLFDTLNPTNIYIDTSATKVYVNGDLILSGTSIASGWTYTCADLITGYRYVLTPNSPLEEKQYTFLVEGAVTFPESSTCSYSWTLYVPELKDQIWNKFNVSGTQLIKTPTYQNFSSSFDEHGSLVSLKRNLGEKNWEHRRRIRKVFSERTNSAYQGLVNSITNALNLSIEDAFVINPRLDSNENFLAPDPYVLIEGTKVYLYSDYTNNYLNYEIDRYDSGGNYETLDRLAQYINNNSIYFEAALVGSSTSYTRSMTLLNQSNRDEVKDEIVPVSTKFKLKKEFIVYGSCFFSDRTVFKTEVTSSALVTSFGDYYIDYRNGIVTVYSSPIAGTLVRYSYIMYPFRALGSPVILHSISEDSFKTKMFEQVLQDDGTYENGTLTKLGIELLGELISVKNGLYFGI